MPFSISSSDTFTDDSEEESPSPGSIAQTNLSSSKDTLEEMVKDTSVAELERLVKYDAILSYDPLCVRKKGNWAKMDHRYQFDHPAFSIDAMKKDMPTFSPKMVTLFQKIKEQDERDMAKHGTLFKHFIFTDLKNSAKLLASALIAEGMHLGYAPSSIREVSKKTVYGKIELTPHEELAKTPFSNFYLFSSVGVYDKPISVAMKKQILRNFNARPLSDEVPDGNIYGKYARIIIMDSGFKEGIDLFDIKYIHIFEPQLTAADQKQVIGRGTRTCGQKGLTFHPRRGWALYVTIYDTAVPKEVDSVFIGANSLFDLYLKSLKLDLRLFQFAAALEETTIYGSVDYELNRNIHNFVLEDSPSLSFGGSSLSPKTPEQSLVEQSFDKKRGFEEMRKYIRENFAEFSWDSVKMENLCSKTGMTGYTGIAGGIPQLIEYTPTQDFIRHYFTPENPVKGMLLWQSVGTGKTCTAIATATSTFEKQGYTILWVTRTTLKNDIWKNMFEQVCNESIRDQLNQNIPYPTEQAKRMRLLSKAWRIRPMSYKQFSNLVSKENKMYDTLVKINGEQDPLRKTLLIIDEVHKLYGGEDLSSLERPNLFAFHESLMKSYAISGKDSVRLLLMSATPITQNPMELIKLLNLCKPMEEQMPTTFADFSKEYLDEAGVFTERGRAEYVDAIAGHVSYLNREKDARQFAQPMISFTSVPLVENTELVKKYDSKWTRLYLGSDIVSLKKEIKERTEKIAASVGDLDANRFRFLQRKCAGYEAKVKKECEKIVKSSVSEMIKEARAYGKEVRGEIKKIREETKNKELFQREALKDISENLQNEGPEYEKYKRSLYSYVKGCGKTIRNKEDLMKVLNQHPALMADNAEVEALDKEIEHIQERDKVLAAQWNARRKQLKNILKYGDFTDLEKTTVRATMKGETVAMRKLRKTTKKEIQADIENVKQEKKAIQKTRRKTIRNLTKAFRTTLKNRKEEEKEIKMAEKELRKEARKVGEFEEEAIIDEYLANLVKKYQDHIDSQMEGANQAKAAKAQARAEEKATKKAQEKAAKALRKTKKAQEKLQKVQERETRKAQEKLQKVQEREAKKAQEKLEREAKKAQEKLERETKKAQEKAAKALRKTKKNKTP